MNKLKEVLLGFFLIAWLGSLAYAAVYNWGYGDYSGTSLDTKPTGTMRDGRRFYETDTKKVYIRSSGTWTEITHTMPGNVVYTAETMTVTYGTLVSGTVGSLATVGTGSVVVDEVVGANALQIDLEFTGVTAFNNIAIKGRYDGSATTDNVAIELYNNDTAQWEEFGRMATANEYTWYSYAVFEDTEYINAGSVRLRFRHLETGKNGHSIDLDYVIVQEAVGGGGGSITDHGSLTGLIDPDHPFSAITGSIDVSQLPETYATATSLSSHTSVTTGHHGQAEYPADDATEKWFRGDNTWATIPYPGSWTTSQILGVGDARWFSVQGTPGYGIAEKSEKLTGSHCSLCHATRTVRAAITSAEYIWSSTGTLPETTLAWATFGSNMINVANSSMRVIGRGTVWTTKGGTGITRFALYWGTIGVTSGTQIGWATVSTDTQVRTRVAYTFDCMIQWPAAGAAVTANATCVANLGGTIAGSSWSTFTMDTTVASKAYITANNTSWTTATGAFKNVHIGQWWVEKGME